MTIIKPGETAENNLSLTLFIYEDFKSIVCVMELSKAIIVLTRVSNLLLHHER